MFYFAVLFQMDSYDDSSLLYCSQVLDDDGKLVGIHSSQATNNDTTNEVKIFKNFLLTFCEDLLTYKYRYV